MAEDLCYLADVLYQVVEDVGQKIPLRVRGVRLEYSELCLVRLYEWLVGLVCWLSGGLWLGDLLCGGRLRCVWT